MQLNTALNFDLTCSLYAVAAEPLQVERRGDPLSRPSAETVTMRSLASVHMLTSAIDSIGDGIVDFVGREGC